MLRKSASLVLLAALAVLTAARGAAAQEEPEGRVDLLHSGDIRVREEAGCWLGQLSPSALPMLRQYAANESDLEVRFRLTQSIMTISEREAARLILEGKVDDSLPWLVPVSEGESPEDVVRETKQAVREELRRWFSESPCSDDFPRDMSVVASTVDDRFGPWGTAVLLDALAEDDGSFPAVSILQEMGRELLPCLLRALERGSVVFQREILYVLYGMASVQGRTLEESFRLELAVAAMIADPRMDAGTQTRGRDVLARIRAEFLKEALPLFGAAP